MKKLILLAGLLAGLWASPASAQCNGNFAAGTVCGSNSGGAPGPITSFATLGTCNVLSQGAKGDGVTDDTAAFQACVTKLTTGTGTIGGTLYLPPAPNGIYCLYSGLSITTSFSIEILGSSYGDQTSMSVCNHDVTLLTLNNASHSIRNVGLVGSNVVNTTHDTLVLGSNCTECLIDHVKFNFGRYVINVAANDVRISNISAGSPLGGAVIYTTGSFSCSACKLDTAYPVSSPVYGTTFSAWQSGFSYTTPGTVVSTAGSQAGQTYLIQLKTAGTSGGSAPTLQPLGVNITDNTAVWQLVGLQTNAAVQADTGSSTVTISNRSDLSGPYTYGLYLTGNAQTVLMTNSFIGGWYSAGVYQNSSVGGVTLVGNQIQNCVNTGCQAVYLHAPGDAQVIGNQIFGVGIGVETDGASNITISSNFVFGAHVAGVYINGTAATVSVTSNQLGTSASWGTNAIGVDIVGAGTDYLTVSGNQCHGATTCVSNSSTGTHNLIETTPGIFNATAGNGCVYFNGTNGLTCIGSLVADSSGDLSSNATIQAPNIALKGSSTGVTNLQTNNSGASTFTATVQAATDTVVDRATVDTLTNKTYDTGGTGNVFKFNGTQIIALGIGLGNSGTNLVSNAEVIDYFAPGLVAAVTNTKGAFTLWKNASTVDNIAASATAFTCSGNPTVTIFECGTSTTCASPTTIGAVTLTGAGTVVSFTSLSSSTINAGDYTAWAISAGTCTSLDIHGKIQAHAN